LLQSAEGKAQRAEGKALKKRKPRTKIFIDYQSALSGDDNLERNQKATVANMT